MKKVIAILLAAVFLLSGCAQTEEGGLTSFSAYDLSGKIQTQEIFAGKKLTMVNIWATYCGPCIREMPGLGELSEEYADQGFQIVGIISDVADHKGSQAETALGILEYTDANYVNLVLSESLMPVLQTVSAVPTTIFVNEKGEQIGQYYIGSREKEDWEAIITELLEDAV